MAPVYIFFPFIFSELDTRMIKKCNCDRYSNVIDLTCIHISSAFACKISNIQLVIAFHPGTLFCDSMQFRNWLAIQMVFLYIWIGSILCTIIITLQYFYKA